MKRIIFSLLFWQAVISAQTNFKVDIDYARFFYDDSTGYIEIYYGFYTPNMSVKESAGKKEVAGKLSINIFEKSTNALQVNKQYQFQNPVFDSSSAEETKSLIGVLTYRLKYGEYICKIFASDLNDTTQSEDIAFEFTLDYNKQKTFFASDIQLANSITKIENENGDGSPFYKNTFDVIPNPSGVYGDKMPVVFFYSELYSINKDINELKLRLDYLLVNSSSKTVYRKRKFINRDHASLVDVGTCNVSKFPSGSYTLVQILSDSIKNISYLTSKKVFLFNPGIIDSTTLVKTDGSQLATEFGAMSEEELNEIYEQSSYISVSDENKQWERLTNAEGKKKFLVAFWSNRIFNPEFPEIDFKNEYFNRVKQANERFTTIQKVGWKTDRGRVFITYGEPSEIERFPNEVDKKPYEIWYYNQIEGGVQFVFGDLSGFSDYLLLHSTKRGELRDDDWAQRIFVH